MSKNLMIVESPHKAKTIEQFLGEDFRVLSSQGHIRDIDGVGKNSMGIDFNNHYQPNYVLDPQKTELINTLRREVKKADTVWLASDDDREGEAIAWHLYEVLQLQNKPTHRITFLEITKKAIQEALLHPRDIDYNMVNAQQARRIIDRIVGYELSPVLWKKVTTGLSAGRVQSVAVRLIVEREREVEQFASTAQYRVIADFTGRNPGDASVLHTELTRRFDSKKDAMKFLELCRISDFRISDIQRKPVLRTPASPFTTSLLQQEAARKLRFTVSRTMRLAQSLYEAGHITYMRTDSTNLSGLAIATAQKEIIAQYGERYHKARQYHTNSKGAQEAHEAIRPSYLSVHSAGQNEDERRLYELIWKRTIASQMADAELDTTRIEVEMMGQPYTFVATGEVVTFDGFMRAYVQSSDEPEESNERMLPHMALHEQLRTIQIDAIQSFQKPPSRFNEATLVKKLEELGIGRPSTYATIIETIQQRKYVERGSVAGQKREYNILSLKSGKITDKQKQEIFGSDLQKLLPTDLGRITNDFLVEQFPDILDYDFTANEEQTFDMIADGEANWVESIDTFYNTFHPTLARVPQGKVAGRVIGTDPKTGEKVIAKISKLGPCVQLGDNDNEKPRFASLKKGQSLFTITLQEALQLFETKFPFVACQIDGEDVVVGEGKYGPYLKYNGEFTSIPKGMDPFGLQEDDIRQILAQRDQVNAVLMQWDDIQIVNGRYGAYIKTSTANYRLPRNEKVDNLTLERVKEIISAALSEVKKPQKRTFSRKKAK